MNIEMENTKEIQLTGIHNVNEVANDLVELTKEIVAKSKSWTKRNRRWILAVGTLAISFSTIAPMVAKIVEPKIKSENNKDVLPPVEEELPPVSEELPSEGFIIETQEQLNEYVNGNIQIKLTNSNVYQEIDKFITNGLSTSFSADIEESIGINVEFLSVKPDNVLFFYQLEKIQEQTNLSFAKYEFVLSAATDDNQFDASCESVEIYSLNKLELSDEQKVNEDLEFSKVWFANSEFAFTKLELEKASSDFFVPFEQTTFEDKNYEMPNLPYSSSLDYTLAVIDEQPGEYSFFELTFRVSLNSSFAMYTFTIQTIDKNPGLVDTTLFLLNEEKQNFINAKLTNNIYSENSIEEIPSTGQSVDQSLIWTDGYDSNNENINIQFNVVSVDGYRIFVEVIFSIENIFVTHEYEVNYTKGSLVSGINDEASLITNSKAIDVSYLPWQKVLPDKITNSSLEGITPQELVSGYQFKEDHTYKLSKISWFSNDNGMIAIEVIIGHIELHTTTVAILKLKNLLNNAQSRTNILIDMIKLSLNDNGRARSVLPDTRETLASEITNDFLAPYNVWTNAPLRIKQIESFTVPGTTLLWDIIESDDANGEIKVMATIKYGSYNVVNNKIEVILTGFKRK